MVADALIYLAGLTLAGGIGWLLWTLEGARRVGVEPPAPDPVPVALRLDADARQRLSRPHLSAVRARDRRVVPFAPGAHRHAASLGRGKK